MSTPIALSDEEKDVLLKLAAPVAVGQRQEFLERVAAALADCQQPGPGVVYRTAALIQRDYTHEFQHEAACGPPPQRYRPRATAQV